MLARVPLCDWLKCVGGRFGTRIGGNWLLVVVLRGTKGVGNLYGTRISMVEERIKVELALK